MRESSLSLSLISRAVFCFSANKSSWYVFTTPVVASTSEGLSYEEIARTFQPTQYVRLQHTGVFNRGFVELQLEIVIYLIGGSPDMRV